MISSASGSRSLTNRAFRGTNAESPPDSFRANPSDASPLSLITPIPLLPTGVISATIVFSIRISTPQRHDERKEYSSFLCALRAFVVNVLLQPDLKSAFAAVADRFGKQIVFFLKCQVNDSALGRIQ